MTATIVIRDAVLRADPSGALFWPEQGIMVVADLHLEKGSSYARGHQFLPPYDSRETIDRLAATLRRFAPKRVICLGDSFHDRAAADRLDAGERDRLTRMIAAQDWVWIAGNHDPAPPRDLGGVVMAEVTVNHLTFRHQPEGRELAPGEIVGHFHPKASIATAARRVTGRCFAIDASRAILPAFGAYAGGLDVLDPAIAGLFGRARFKVLLIGDEKIHLFGRAQLSPIARPRTMAR